jgi:hypothetical protein
MWRLIASLLIIDEADRLRMASLEQAGAIFDAGDIGGILIGMPGLQKELARYPQFYYRIAFVHEFRPLSALQIRQLLEQRWAPPDVSLPQQPWTEEVIAAIIQNYERNVESKGSPWENHRAKGAEDLRNKWASRRTCALFRPSTAGPEGT